MFRKNRISNCLVVRAFVFYFAFWAVLLPAAESDSLLKKLKEGRGDPTLRGSIFVHGDPSLDSLLPVRVIGFVYQAGVHYIPDNIDLLTMIALVGGVRESADLDEILVKRVENGKSTLHQINLEELMANNEKSDFILRANDVVYVRKDEKFISDETARLISLIASLATIFGTVVVGINGLK